MVAYLVEGDALHADAVEAIESTMKEGSSLAISAVTWAELLHGALLGHLPEDALREFVDDFGIEILPVDGEVAEEAAFLQKTYRETNKKTPRPKLRTPDALILGTSVARELEIVICGDEKWSRVPGVDAKIILIREQ